MFKMNGIFFVFLVFTSSISAQMSPNMETFVEELYRQNSFPLKPEQGRSFKWTNAIPKQVTSISSCCHPNQFSPSRIPENSFSSYHHSFPSSQLSQDTVAQASDTVSKMLPQPPMMSSFSFGNTDDKSASNANPSPFKMSEYSFAMPQPSVGPSSSPEERPDHQTSPSENYRTPYLARFLQS